jgi:hypothetical protein
MNGGAFMKHVSAFFACVGLGLPLVLFSGYFIEGPSFLYAFTGDEMPKFGDGIMGSLIALLDRYWSYLIMIQVVGMVLMVWMTYNMNSKPVRKTRQRSDVENSECIED